MAEVQGSDNPQIQKAIDLCTQYIPKAGKKLTASSSISALWKKSEERRPLSHETPQSLATAVLGENLVATITEKKQSPPDVSYIIFNLHAGKIPTLPTFISQCI